MLATAAAVLMIILPGSQVPSTPYATVAACHVALDQLMQSERGLLREVPRFHAWCEPSGPELMS